MKLKYYIAYVIAVIGVMLSIQSCRDDNYEIEDYTLTGEDVILEVGISLPTMDKQTRANLDETSLNQVESLWIRTYSADTGKATSDWYKAENEQGFVGNTGTENPHSVTIKTQSGMAYIVAVANVANLGVTKDNITDRKPLSELLETADTWDDFLNIAVVSPSTSEGVRAPIPPLPMSGCYSDIIVGGDHPEPTSIDGWQKNDFQPYFIPVKSGVVDFTDKGAIHLRRLVSHLNFNVKPGNDNIEVVVNSYQVMNAPRFSWLYERPAENRMPTNFGDLAQSETDAASYYVNIPQFGSQFITENDDGSSSFDFWQAENKHSGVDDLDTYANRDLKSGKLFTNLTGSTWTPNNEASYVLIQCTVDYIKSIDVDDEGVITPDGTTTVYRSGEVTYLVHLGYVGVGTEAEKAKDFNCFRNVDYTYNITINGLNDIRVDAYAKDAKDETYHGEEGLVVDLANETIDIDAHYAAFNIQLTQAELQGDFGFIITTYENGNQINITDANRQEGSGQTKIIYDRDGVTVIDPKFYNWIELRPTTGENVLAEYKPRYGDNSDGATFLLTDLYTAPDSPVSVWSIMSDNMKSTSGWYTVFVNEYTYEPMYTGGTAAYANEQWDGTGRPAWMGYVNQNPRRFYIRVTQSVSPDGNSLYARSKYGVSQQSLMSYYSDQTITQASGDIPAGTAIGVERINENEGMNLRHTFAGGTSTANGRWNTAMYLNGSATNTTDLSINRNNANQRPQWTNYIDYASPMEVGAVTGERAQDGPDIPARTIENGNPFKLPKLLPATGSYTFNDPQANDNYTIEAINACMSRNRDNNGNGRIEPDELRWYVPAMDQYLAMMLGEGSLPEPLMNYRSINSLPYVAGSGTGNPSWSQSSGSIINDYYTRYMCVSSNNNVNVMWLMEGTSTSEYDLLLNWSGNVSHPWQVRCIRNLGANLTTVLEDDKVSKPYVHDEATHRFRMTYYDLASVRTNPYYGNGTGASQMPVHTIASPYNSVYYGFEYDTTDITIPSDNRPILDNFDGTYNRLQEYINSNPCGTAGLTGTGWRLPNQEELTIMRNAGLLTSINNPNAAWLSCTVNYFNHVTGAGSVTDVNNRRYLVVTPGQGTQLTLQNFNYAGNNFYIRCVRDVNN